MPIASATKEAPGSAARRGWGAGGPGERLSREGCEGRRARGCAGTGNRTTGPREAAVMTSGRWKVGGTEAGVGSHEPDGETGVSVHNCDNYAGRRGLGWLRGSARKYMAGVRL